METVPCCTYCRTYSLKLQEVRDDLQARVRELEAKVKYYEDKLELHRIYK